jgi:hypothetical protein
MCDRRGSPYLRVWTDAEMHWRSCVASAMGGGMEWERMVQADSMQVINVARQDFQLVMMHFVGQRRVR